MLTLPSNMFYTVTLPATLWFFDRAKPDDRILFIDARNVFTQLDRAHREFSEEQVANLALISHLRHGHRDRFVRQIDRYFETGLVRLRENHAQVAPVSAQLIEVLADAEGRAAVGGLVSTWTALAKLEKEYASYVGLDLASSRSVKKHNRAQQKLSAAFDPFFAALHDGLKHLDKIVRAHEKALAAEAAAEGKRATADRKTKALKTALETLHAEVKNAESSFGHIRWLQERFPGAAYEDVTGLCKLATPAEVEEQEFSLNPGRYVGVVIEEDGKTEEEFSAELIAANEELAKLNSEARTLEKIIGQNLAQITGEA